MADFRFKLKNRIMSDSEDLPSNFFDDFNKKEFMDGFDIVDTWNDEDSSQKRRSRPRIDASAIGAVKDLRELITPNCIKENLVASDNKRKRYQQNLMDDRHSQFRRGRSSSILETHIKPAHRRNSNKANKNLKRHKAEKEYLAKLLETDDDLKPPGTELDNFKDLQNSRRRSGSKEKRRKHYPSRHQRVTCHSPKENRLSSHHNYYSHNRHYAHHSSSSRRTRVLYSPDPSKRYQVSSLQRSPREHIPHSHSLMCDIPVQPSPAYHSFLQHSPASSILRNVSNPVNHTYSLFPKQEDAFLYPDTKYTEQFQMSKVVYSTPVPTKYSGVTPRFSYQHVPYQTYKTPCDHTLQLDTQNFDLGDSVPVSNTKSAPVMVPPPTRDPEISDKTINVDNRTSEISLDAISELVEDDNLTKEEFEKLASEKGASSCFEAWKSIDELEMQLVPDEIEQKNCSPLKRETIGKLNFTSNEINIPKHNKQLVNKIILTLDLDGIVPTLKERAQSDMKDAEVQTMNTFSDIHNTNRTRNVGTSTEVKYFTSTVHTQVVEQDLYSSKSSCNSRGSISPEDPLTIAHLTSAQLIQQLAARAKSLKQTETSSPTHQHRY